LEGDGDEHEDALEEGCLATRHSVRWHTPEGERLIFE
jgi:hypothetical protein